MKQLIRDPAVRQALIMTVVVIVLGIIVLTATVFAVSEVRGAKWALPVFCGIFAFGVCLLILKASIHRLKEAAMWAAVAGLIVAGLIAILDGAATERPTDAERKAQFFRHCKTAGLTDEQCEREWNYYLHQSDIDANLRDPYNN